MLTQLRQQCLKYDRLTGNTGRTEINGELYEELLSACQTNHGGIVFVVRDGVVRGTNSDGEVPSELEAAAKRLELTEKPSLLSIFDGLYLGAKESCMDYELYAFQPTEFYVKSCLAVSLLLAGAYIILVMLVYIMKYRMEKSHILEKNANLRIIQSISKIFSLSILVNVERNEYSIINAPPHIRELGKQTGSAAEFFECVGKYVVEQYSSVYRELTDPNVIGRLLADREHAEFVIQDKSGVWFRNIIIANEWNADDQISSFILVSRNIDEQKKKEIEDRESLVDAMEAARLANNAKTDFLRRMSHDIRTPISVIVGMADLGERFSGDGEKQKYCRDKVKTAAAYLLELVNDVLMVNRAVQGGLELERKAFRLGETVSDLKEIIEIQAEEKGVSFVCGDVWKVGLIGSQLHLRQILMNILTNAVKYTPSGGSVELLCGGQPLNDGKALVRFICRDTGIGMSEEFQKHMFEPFTQENPENADAFSGIGLGLPIVRMLTEKMGGTVKVMSKKNKGTCFIVEIPFEVDLTSCGTDMKNAEALKDRPLEGLTVLAAEDNELNLEIVRVMLEDMGANVLCASDGAEAVKIWENSEDGLIDAILMDIIMPGMDGVEAAGNIRKSLKKGSGEVAVIALSANVFDEDAELCMEAGMNAFISKPFSAEKLALMILSGAQTKGRANNVE